MELVAAAPFDEAVAKLGSRSVVAAMLNSAQWRDVPVALRDRSFFSSQVESVRFLQRGQDSIKDFLAGARDPDTGALKTGSRAAFVQQMQKFAIAEGMGPLKPADKGTIKDITSQQRLGLIFDVQTKSARDYSNWKQGMDKDVLDEFPAQKFIRVRRVKKPRSYHQAALGKVALKTDLKFWISLNPDFGVPWGPWGFNSGCDVEDVDRAAAQKQGLLKRNEPVKPVVKDFNEGLAASVRGLSDDLVRSLISKFGDKVELAGDQVVWKGRSPIPATPPPAIPEPPDTPARQPPAAPEEAPPRTPTSKPVSDAFEVHLSEAGVEQAQIAFESIDGVHEDGALREMPLGAEPESSTSLGTYNPGVDGIYALTMRENGPWPALNVLHEVGHVLDHQALGRDAVFDATSEIGTPGAQLAPWLHAVHSTYSVVVLRERLARATDPNVRRYLEYLLKPDELWARCYAQYIAEKSGHPVLAEQLERARAVDPDRQWDAADFVPVSTAIDELFASLGWSR